MVKASFSQKHPFPNNIKSWINFQSILASFYIKFSITSRYFSGIVFLMPFFHRFRFLVPFSAAKGPDGDRLDSRFLAFRAGAFPAHESGSLHKAVRRAEFSVSAILSPRGVESGAPVSGKLDFQAPFWLHLVTFPMPFSTILCSCL